MKVKIFIQRDTDGCELGSRAKGSFSRLPCCIRSFPSSAPPPGLIPVPIISDNASKIQSPQAIAKHYRSYLPNTSPSLLLNVLMTQP